MPFSIDDKKIGESFVVVGHSGHAVGLTTLAKLLPECGGCYFYQSGRATCIDRDYPIGNCSSSRRADETDVVFATREEINNIKQRINDYERNRT